jgi:hypothetical protein
MPSAPRRRPLPRSTRASILAILALASAFALVGLVVHIRNASTQSPSLPALQLAPPAVPAAMSQPAFPLKAGPTARYLVDRDGRPFLIVGDSPPALIGDLSEAQAARFLANRQAAGVNSVWVNLLCNGYTGCRSDGTTYDGIAPFRRPGDLATPNPAYFTRADAVLRLAFRRHLAVFLDPIETGGWLGVLQRNGAGRAYAYGRYLGRRNRAFSNIVWLNGNDFQTWRRPADDALALAVARGIRSTDPGALQSVELNYPTSSSLDDTRWRGMIGLDAAYTYAPTYAEVLKAYGGPTARG